MHRGSVTKVQKSEMTACRDRLTLRGARVHVIQENLTRALVCTLFGLHGVAWRLGLGRTDGNRLTGSHTVLLPWSHCTAIPPRAVSLPATVCRCPGWFPNQVRVRAIPRDYLTTSFLTSRGEFKTRKLAHVGEESTIGSRPDSTSLDTGIRTPMLC
jgi:hypothetical protein